MSTEAVSPRYADLDLWPTPAAVEAMAEAQVAASAVVLGQARNIADAADAAAERLREGGGRLVYVGAGTSGRVAVQDGVELGPTFDWPDERLRYLLAGGLDALVRSVEGAEDDGAAGETAMAELGPCSCDVVIGVAASGRTPYTVAALRAASRAGALTIGIAGNEGTPLSDGFAHSILLPTGAEVVAGSTRMKAGTAQKIALNCLSTAIMIRLGRVHGGLMVDMRPSNAKLRARAVAMVAEIASVPIGTARAALQAADGEVKVAALIASGHDREVAVQALAAAGGRLRGAMVELASVAQRAGQPVR